MLHDLAKIITFQNSVLLCCQIKEILTLVVYHLPKTARRQLFLNHFWIVVHLYDGELPSISRRTRLFDSVRHRDFFLSSPGLIHDDDLSARIYRALYDIQKTIQSLWWNMRQPESEKYQIILTFRLPGKQIRLHIVD